MNRINPTHIGNAVPSGRADWWQDHVFFPLAGADGSMPDGWVLPQGAVFRRNGDGFCLEVSDRAAAMWTASSLASGQLDLCCRLQQGTAVVSLRASARDGIKRQYELRVATSGIQLIRRTGDVRFVLASNEGAIASEQWHDITMTMQGNRLTVWLNGRRVLAAVDDDPLPTGSLALGGLDDARIEYSDMLVWALPPWADNEMEDIRHQIAARRHDAPRFVRSILHGPLYFCPPAPPPGVPLAFEKAVECGINQPTIKYFPAAINSGPIPPNFIHSWAIDLRDIHWFAFDWGSLDPCQGLNLSGGDRLYVVDSANQVLKDFRPTDSDWTVKLASPAGTAYDQPSAVRVYLILETSAVETPRRLQVRGVINTTPPAQATGAEAALLVEDDLNYDPSLGPLFWATDYQGTRIPVAAPWGLPESIHHHQVNFPPPGLEGGRLPGDGWCLVGKHTAEYAEEQSGFFSLVYYNERLGMARIYLWNLRVTDATAYWVTMSMQRRTKQGFEDLSGALFVNDPRPTRWSTAETIIPAWPATKWSYVEVPMMLYPMALRLTKKAAGPASDPTAWRSFTIEELQQEMENAGLSKGQAEDLIRRFQLRGEATGQASLDAVLKSTKLSDTAWVSRLLEVQKPEAYQSVYEERFEPEAGMCNFRLRICVRPLDIGKAELDFIGKATGQGVQLSAAATVNLAEQAFDAFEKAGDWYGKGESIHKKILELIEEQKQGAASGPSAALLAPLAAMGSSGWGAILAAVAIWVSIFKELFSDKPEPLRMAIELAIWGKVTGVLTTDKQERNHYIYLPGRFSFRTAFAQGKIHTRYMNNILPRYDRPLGLFGFRYDPSTLRLPVGQRWYVSGDSPWAECLIPARPYDGAEYLDTYAAPLERHLTRQVDRWLPVIFNPYAEFVLVNPRLRAPDINLENALAGFTWEFGKGAPFPDFLTPEFVYPARKDEPIFHHEPWFDWIQDMSLGEDVVREADDHAFPVNPNFKAGSRAYILAYSPVKTAGLIYSVFHVSPLVDLNGAPLPRRVGMKWGSPPPVKRDVRNGVWLAVPPVAFVPGVYLPATDTVSIGTDHYGFAAQTPVAPQTYQGFTDVTRLSVQQGWRALYYGSVPEDGLAWNFDEDRTGFPIEDALFCWDIEYVYYGRTRKQGGSVPLAQHTAHFRVPVDIHVMWKFKSFWNVDDEVPETDMGYKEVLYRSSMLQGPS